MEERFIRIVYASGDFVDVLAHHWNDLVSGLNGEHRLLNVTMIGGDPLVIRIDSIDSIARISSKGLNARRLHDELFWGNDGTANNR